MREIINVECKRVMNKKLLGLIFVIGFAFSIFCVISNYNSYNIYDSSGKVIVRAKDNLSESKKSEKYISLDDKALSSMVNGTDKSNYIYNINALRLLLITYQDKNVSELTKSDLDSFYHQRITSLESSVLMPIGIFSQEQIEHLKMKAQEMENPLPIGYAEGWKNLNNDMSNLALIILIILSVLLLFVFGETPKSNMSELCNSTRHGKKRLIITKIVTGLTIASIVYFLFIITLTVTQLMFFGINGYNLPIQSDAFYFFSSWNITFLELYLLNVFIGYVAIIFMAAIIMFFTAVTKQLIGGGILTTFFWIIMLSILNNLFTSFGITHNLSNFFPYNMTNFNKLSKTNEIYEVFGRMIPNWIWIVIVALIASTIIMSVIYFLTSYRLSRKHLIKNNKPFFKMSFF